MTYADNLLTTKMSENEFYSAKEFMQTSAQQIDNVAWTIGRTQTVNYYSKVGAVNFQEAAVDYTFQVHTSAGWETLSLSGETGIVMFNIPVSDYSMGNGYFERVPDSASSSFIQFGSSAPVSQVFCEENLPMGDGSYLRVVVVPTLRVLTSTVSSDQNSTKFYLPILESGDSPYKSQSLTLTGDGISKVTRSGVDQVIVSVSFPQAASLGFTSSFFNFQSTSITLDSTSNPPLTPNSIVEFYLGAVQVKIGVA